MTSLALAPDSILQKTAAGAEEIATRKTGLSARLRPLLILVDGKLSVEQLLAKAQALGLSHEHLRALLGAGMCEVLSAALPAPTLAPPPAGPVTQERRPAGKRSVAVARMYLLEQMDRFLGAESEPVRVAIREARSHGEVLQVLELSLEVVRNTAGESRAGLLRERVTELLPEPA